MIFAVSWCTLRQGNIILGLLLFLFQSTLSFTRIAYSSSAINFTVLLNSNVLFLSLDSRDSCDDWHYLYCQNIDKNMEGLVSPSPESFHVVHSALDRFNRANTTNIEDISTLSQYLVKPSYTMELFREHEKIKWRMIKGEDNVHKVIVDPSVSIKKGRRELYHDFSTLQLSQAALDFATNETSCEANIPAIHKVVHQAKKRIALTLGSDLRGRSPADACFNFALAGVDNSSANLFHSLVSLGVHELKRAGKRSSFPSKSVLHVVEKFAASGIPTDIGMELYQIAADCLDKKKHEDKSYIDSLRRGTFGFQGRPLLWLWRFSSRQKKVAVEIEALETDVKWQDEFIDTSRPIVVDIGSGMGTCILGLSATSSNSHKALPIQWSQCNYAGVDLNQALVRFGNGVASRQTNARQGKNVKFFCCRAEDFLYQLKSYEGRKALIMANFPSPYRLRKNGNLQLPTEESFMLTDQLFELIKDLDCDYEESYFMFQTKCEDVAVFLKNKCLSNGMIGIMAGENSVGSIDDVYSKTSIPKRVTQWLLNDPLAERAQGSLFWDETILPLDCRPETEIQCLFESKAVHRCLFKLQG